MGEIYSINFLKYFNGIKKIKISIPLGNFPKTCSFWFSCLSPLSFSPLCPLPVQHQNHIPSFPSCNFVFHFYHLAPNLGSWFSVKAFAIFIWKNPHAEARGLPELCYLTSISPHSTPPISKMPQNQGGFSEHSAKVNSKITGIAYGQSSFFVAQQLVMFSFSPSCLASSAAQVLSSLLPVMYTQIWSESIYCFTFVTYSSGQFPNLRWDKRRYGWFK